MASFYNFQKEVYMLRKSKRIEKGSVPAPSPVSMGEKTIIGEKIFIEGSIQGKGDLVIDGSVNGSIELEEYHLTVGPKGRVEADIHADNVTISGRMTGNIKAGCKVEITKDADFNGEIKAKHISVEDGAYLKAAIELEREPQKKAVPGKEPLTLVSEADKGE
jgi:cytoskeletal protein CcmA (bactofilin family)